MSDNNELLDSIVEGRSVKTGQFVKGNTQGKGRPKGSRNKMTQRMLNRGASRLGMSLYDYANAYVGYRTIVMSQAEHNLLCSVDNPSDWFEFYDNMFDVYNCLLDNGELITDVVPPRFSGSLLHPDDPIFDPNKYERNIKTDEQNELKYNDWLKRAKINDYTASLRLDYITNELNSKHHAKYLEKTVAQGASSALW